MNPRSRFLILLCLVILSLPSIKGQVPWKTARFQKAIDFDGRPDEPVWEQAVPFPMVTLLPVAGKPPSEHSDIRLGYDDHFLYVGCRLLVSDPSRVRPIGKKRDLQSMNCDWFGISLDTYNDKENALLFFTNPNGLRWDATIQNDGTPVGEIEPLNMNWNTHWEVKTDVDQKGWYVEMRIPVSSLRFQKSGENVIMGISIFRWMPALNQGVIYPETPLNWGWYSNMKPSVYAEAEFSGLEPKRPLYISPYLLAGYQQEHVLNGTGDAYDPGNTPILEPGLDLKFGLTPNTTLDLTVNTDFAQVEADDQQFNLTRFSLFFPEKRMFFLERSSIFDFQMGGETNLFYSRRIGLYDGQPVRIYGGARLNSRINDWDLGFLDMQTASFEDLPSENFGVFRVKKRVFNEYSYTGGIFTSRLGVDGRYNVAYGLDGVIRLFGDEYLTLRWAQTFQEGQENNPLSLDPTRFLAYWERRRQEGWSYLLAGAWSGTAFDPGIGFEDFNDYWVTREELRYTWISPDSARMQSHNILYRNFHLNSVVDNSLLLYNTGPVWTFMTKDNWGGSVSLVYNYEYLEEDFSILDPVSVPSGRYHFLNTNILFNTPGSRSLSAMVTFDGGGYYDGWRFSPGIQPLWSIGSSMELGGIYQFDRVEFSRRQQSLSNHIVGIRALYMMNTHLSLSAFIQYNTAIDKVISNIRFRYNPKEGTDLYIVFNEGRNTFLEREVPALPPFDQRSVTVKFTYTFER